MTLGFSTVDRFRVDSIPIDDVKFAMTLTQVKFPFSPGEAEAEAQKRPLTKQNEPNTSEKEKIDPLVVKGGLLLLLCAFFHCTNVLFNGR